MQVRQAPPRRADSRCATRLLSVLVVASHPALAGLVQAQLAAEPLDIRVASGADVLAAVQSDAPCDLIVLDIGFGGPEPLQSIRRLRAAGSAVPLLILSTGGVAADRVAGLDAGADDWLAVPFEPPEFAARVRALLRRRGSPIVDVIRRAGVTFDTSRASMEVHGRPVALTSREAGLLRVLLLAGSGVVTRERILDEFYGLGTSAAGNTVEVYVSRLRRKLAGSGLVIRSVHGRGYALETAEGAD